MTSVRPNVIGREDELEAGERFLDAIRGGSASLVLEGEPGIGKTTLWNEIRSRGRERGFCVLTAQPVQSEAALPFAGLLDLVGSHIEPALPRLPRPQRRALELALARADPDSAETVGALATSAGFFSLIIDLAADTPVLVAIDDLQWLDVPTFRLLRFAARRLGPHRIGLLASVRIPSALDSSVPPVDLGTDVDRLHVGPLTTASLYHVINEHLRLSLPRPALTRIAEMSGGNPILALELARTFAAAAPESSQVPLPVPVNVSRVVSRRVEALSDLTRRALVRCSAVARPTVELVRIRELQPALDDGLVSIETDGRVRFAHPLFASAVYGAASPDQRAAAHRWLSGRVTDTDERTLHAALATTKRDAELARRLHEAAERARHRGAPEFAAELEERAASRTPLTQDRARLERLLRAAEHHERAGSVERATLLAGEVLRASSQPSLRARAHQLIAEIAYGQSFSTAIGLLEEAIRQPGAAKAEVAQLELHLSFALMATMALGDALPHARRAEQLAEEAHDGGLFAEALGARVYIQAIRDDVLDREALRRSLLLEDPAREVPVQIRPSQSAAVLDVLLGQIDRAVAPVQALERRLGESGEEHELPFPLNLLALIDLLRGDRRSALRRVDEALRAATLVGSETLRGYAVAVRAVVASFAGDTRAATDDANEAETIFDRVGWGIGGWYVLKARAFLALSHGDPHEVERILGPPSAGLGSAFGYGAAAFFVEDLVDARLAIGNLDAAAGLVSGFSMAGASLDSPWARVIGARGRALLESARGRHLRALDALAEAEREPLPIPSERGRTLLAKGQVLRRLRRKSAARDALVAARQIFSDLEMSLWVAKAGAEIGRIGLRHGSRLDLTETERRVAELAAAGLTNREIAAQAFLTPKSVEDVMSRVYGKLGIRSRAELGARMARH